MTNKKQLNRLVGRVLRLTSLFIAVAGGCGGGGADPPAEGASSPASSWAIRIFVNTSDGKRVPLHVGPPRAAVSASFATANTPLTTKTLGKKVVVEGADAVTNTGPDVLLWGAAVECGMTGGGDVVVKSGVPGRFKPFQGPVVPAWASPESWFVFPNVPGNCDEQLEDEETLLCIADKLAEVADSPRPLTWSLVGAVSPPPLESPVPTGTWTIPPQTAENRFVARDLAINVLAHLARLDSEPIGSSTESCSRRYLTGSSTDLYGTDEPTTLIYPPSHYPMGSQALALERLEFEAHVLRAGVRLLGDLVRESAEDDKAMAESRRARASDPRAGSRAAWGVQQDSLAGYNSFAHIAAVQYGRLEATPTLATPPMSLIGKMGDLLARVDDQPLATPDQVKAAQLLEKSGLVVDRAQLDSDAFTNAVLKAGLRDQLKADAAAANKLASPADLGSLGVAIEQTVDALADEDVRFAFERNLRTYQVIAGSTGTLSRPSLLGLTEGVVPASLPATEGGVFVVKGGLSRSLVPADVKARSLAIAAGSQAGERIDGLENSLEADNAYLADAVIGDNTPRADRYPRWMFQSSQMLAKAYQKRLGTIARVLNGASLEEERAKATADLVGRTVAEIGGWAGGAELHFRIEPTLANWVPGTGTSSAPLLTGLNTVKINISNVTAGTLPGSLDPTDSSVASKYQIFVGTASQAECITGARSNCDATALVAQLKPATTTTVIADPVKLTKWGSVSNAAEVEFSGVPAPAVGESYYLVSGALPTDAGAYAAGNKQFPAIVGAFAGGGTSSWTGAGAVIFDRPGLDVTERVLEANTFHSPELYESTLSETPNYCLPGVDRKTFVPLENELTSDSDQYENSWRHYLNLARTAAARADDLGNQLIAQGTNMELRREAAGEAVTELCGVPADLSSVKYDLKGKLATGGSSAALAACANEPTVDVVFLTDPSPVVTAGDPKLAYAAYANRLMKCCKGAAPENAWCDATLSKKNALCQRQITNPNGPNFLTTAVLRLDAPPARLPDIRPDMCAGVQALHKSLVGSGFDASMASAVLVQPWAEPNSLGAVAQNIQIKLGLDDEWQVLLGGTIFMSSHPGDGVWPGCGISGAKPCDETRAAILESLFRNGTGTIPNTDDRFAVLNEIRWRVEGALWKLGEMAGTVPAGMFDTWVPAANMNSTALDGTPLGGTSFEAPVETYYHPAAFREIAKSELRLIGAPSEAPQLGTVYPVNPRFSNWNDSFKSNEADARLAVVYDAAASYYHAHAVNEAFRPNYSGVSPGPTADVAALTPDRLNAGFALLAGESCPHTRRNVADKPGAWLRALEMNEPPPRRWMEGSTGWVQEKEVASGGITAGTLMRLRRSRTYPGLWVRAVYGSGMIHDIPWDQGTLAGPAGDWDEGWFFESLSNAEPHEWWVEAARSITSPSSSPPAARIKYWTSHRDVSSTCATARKLTAALGIACVSQITGPVLEATASPPEITTEEDLPRVETWMGSLEVGASNQMANLFLTNVPRQVVSDLAARSVASASAKGAVGDKLLELEAEIHILPSAWRQIALDIQQIRTALKSTRLKLGLIRLKAAIGEQEMKIQQYRAYASMATAAAKVITMDPAAAAGGAIAAEATAASELLTLDALKKIAGAKEGEQAKEILLTLSDLQATTATYWTDLAKSIDGLRSSTARIAELSNQRARLSAKVSAEIAKGAGADFVREADGTFRPLPVNTVLRRQYDVAALRYQRALRDAKYAAFLARIAIEQRLGVHLKSLATPIGSLPAPQLWVDDVCKLTGVDYKKLRAATASDSGTAALDDETVGQLANQFIGDYVQKLSDFVDFYNVEYPSHDGTDSTVISLREDILARPASCTVDSVNLLYNSGHLNATGAEATAWRVRPCGPEATCVTAKPLTALPTTTTAPASGDGTWLVETVSASLSDAGLSDGSSVADGAAADASDVGFPSPSVVIPDDLVAAPANVVSQRVHLEAGSYTLSWWDQARSTTGEPFPSSVPNYSVGVFDTSWTLVSDALFTRKPFVGCDGSLDGGVCSADGGGAAAQWSPRQTLTFTLSAPADVFIAFRPSTEPSVLGSVLIANVQLERGSVATTYAPTTVSRSVVTDRCPAVSAARVRKAFALDCVSDAPGAQCYYELVDPFVFATPEVLPSWRRRKFAAGNFNYRHMTLALNLVGTGVRTCGTGADPSCYGSGFIEYSLTHDGNNVDLLAWDSKMYAFDFGIGTINHAKALTAERFITTPISGADSTLLSQPGIQKTELRGRPLEGSYRLRIWKTPELDWDRLEDVQFVLQYQYWSPVHPTSTP